MRYSTDSPFARTVARELGFNPDVRFVMVGRRRRKIFVRGTAGKPEEFQALRVAARRSGYSYKGKEKQGL